MENNNRKKSKAFIITFIIILIILIIGYFMSRNGYQIFGTKGSSGTNKTFTPLLGTSKNGTLDTVNPTNSQNGNPTGGSASGNSNTINLNTGPNSGISTGGNLAGGNGLNGSGGLSGGSMGSNGTLDGNTVPPGFNPLPTPGIDTYPLTSTVDSNTTSTQPETLTPQVAPSICPADDPLVFTSVENATLADLLKQYYLLAPNIKTEDDLSTANAESDQINTLLAQVTDLTNQCYAEKADPSYTGPREVKNNPYYSDPNGMSTPYFPESSQLEQLFNIW